MTQRYLGLIPARGGSKGVPHKNVREVAGRPLIAYSIDAALDARIDRTIVSTDDEEIREVALSHGADAPFLRPEEMATDDAPTEPVIDHAVEYLRDEEDERYDVIVLLQPTTPLRDAADVDAAIERYETTDATSLVAVTEDHSNRWRVTEEGAEKINYDENRRRQEIEPELVENGALYMVDTETFLETGELRAGHTALYVMDEQSSVDIDTPFDLWLAERILEDWYGEEANAEGSA